MCYILLGETPKRFKTSVTCHSRNPMVNPSKIFVRQVDVEFNLQLEVDQIWDGASKKHLMIDWLTMENSKPVKPVIFRPHWFLVMLDWFVSRHAPWRFTVYAVAPGWLWWQRCVPCHPLQRIAIIRSFQCIGPELLGDTVGAWLIHLGARWYHWDGFTVLP